MLLRSLEATGDSLLDGRAGLEAVFGVGDRAGGVPDVDSGGGDEVSFFEGRTVWNADPDDGDGDPGAVQGDFTGDEGDVRGWVAAKDDEPGDPEGMVYGENRFCLNRSLDDKRCWAPDAAAAAAIMPGLFKLWA